MPANPQSNRSQNATSPRNNRTKIGNGARLFFGDGRSEGGRRFRELLYDFAQELGGWAELPVTAQQTCRRLAQITLELETLETQRAEGNGMDQEVYAILTGNYRRLQRDHARIKSAQPKPVNALEEHLRRNYPRPATGQAA